MQQHAQGFKGKSPERGWPMTKFQCTQYLPKEIALLTPLPSMLWGAVVSSRLVTQCLPGNWDACILWAGYWRRIFDRSLPASSFRLPNTLLLLHQRSVSRGWSPFQTIWQCANFCQMCLLGFCELWNEVCGTSLGIVLLVSMECCPCWWAPSRLWCWNRDQTSCQGGLKPEEWRRLPRGADKELDLFASGNLTHCPLWGTFPKANYGPKFCRYQ